MMLMLMKLSALPAQCTRFTTRLHSQEKRRETGQRKPQVLWSVLCRDQCLVMQSGGDRRARHACLLISDVCGGKANFDKKTGVDGKTLIHPNQLVTANEIFAPSAKAVLHAKEVIVAHTEAVSKGENVAVVDGKLVENLHVADARHVLALHEAIIAQQF